VSGRVRRVRVEKSFDGWERYSRCPATGKPHEARNSDRLLRTSTYMDGGFRSGCGARFEAAKERLERFVENRFGGAFRARKRASDRLGERVSLLRGITQRGACGRTHLRERDPRRIARRQPAALLRFGGQAGHRQRR